MVQKKYLVAFFELLIAISMVFNCASVYVTEAHSSWFGKALFILFCVSVSCLCLMSKKHKHMYTRKALLCNVFFGLYLFIYAAMRHTNVVATIQLFIELLLLGNYIILEDKRGLSNILKKYKRLIIILSIISLFFWMFGSVLNFLEPTGQIYSWWANTDYEYAVFKGYFGLHFETQSIDMFDDAGTIRNTSIFTEGPMYSLHLSLALLVELFIEDKISKINIFILVMTLLTTMSSTGYAFMAFALYLKVSIWLKQRNTFKIVQLMINMVFVSFITYIVWHLFDYRSNTVSGLIRLDDYLVALDTWLSNPILGVGINNFEAMKQHMEAWRYFNTGYSNSVGIVLAQGGIWFFVPFVFLFYKAIVSAYFEKRYNSLSVSLLFLYLLFFAVAIYSFNMLIVMAYIVAETNTNQLNYDIA